MNQERIPLRSNATLFLDILSLGLYSDSGKCLLELLRNGAIASMPGTDWVPGVGELDVFFIDDHPLNPKGRLLVVLDRGSGFTKPKFEKFGDLGQRLTDGRVPGATHGGAAQKCIGRFAAFALNGQCQERDPDSGFYVFTRTGQRAPIKFVEMIPSKMENTQDLLSTEIALDDSMLRQIPIPPGSFSAIVIPDPVFKNTKEIEESIRWLVPRKADQMFKLRVGRKLLTPPPLASKLTLTSNDGTVEVYLDRSAEVPDSEPGIWLTDAHTGFRVAPASRLYQQLPYPLGHLDLAGDIFVPGLLQHQDSARGTLHKRYLRSAAWKSVQAFLNGHVAERAAALLGDEYALGSSTFDRDVFALLDEFDQVWGKPDPSADAGMPFPGDDQPPGPTKPGKPSGGKKRTPGTGGCGGKRGDGKPRGRGIRIGEDDYQVHVRQLDSRILAQVDERNGTVLYINTQKYGPMPKRRDARWEHIMLKICEAVGQVKHPDNPLAVTMFVAERAVEYSTRRR